MAQLVEYHTKEQDQHQPYAEEGRIAIASLPQVREQNPKQQQGKSPVHLDLYPGDLPKD